MLRIATASKASVASTLIGAHVACKDVGYEH